MVNWVTTTNDKLIPVDIFAFKYFALVDSCSDVHLIRKDIYEAVNKPKLNYDANLENTSVQPKNILSLELLLDDGVYKIDAFVISTDAMVSDIILGRDFLRQMEVII